MLHKMLALVGRKEQAALKEASTTVVESVTGEMQQLAKFVPS